MGIQGGKVTIYVLCKAIEDVVAHNIVDSLLIAGGGRGGVIYMCSILQSGNLSGYIWVISRGSGVFIGFGLLAML